MPRRRDTLTFFQAFINEMVDVGGANLPKSISVSLGAKLGKILRERGVTGIENSLMRIYNALKAKIRINVNDDNSYDIYLKFSKKFCPIGGKLNPERANIIQETICIPYTTSILNTIHPDLRFHPDFKECIVRSNDNICHYHLKTEEKRSG